MNSRLDLRGNPNGVRKMIIKLYIMLDGRQLQKRPFFICVRRESKFRKRISDIESSSMSIIIVDRNRYEWYDFI